MRFLVQVSIPVEAANAAMKAGTFAPTLQSILADLKPEAVYFAEVDGERTAFLVVNIQDASQIPAVSEPFFQALGAAVQFHPAMTADDLMRAGPAIEQAAKRYG